MVHRANVRSRTRVRALCISLTRIGAARRWRSFFCAMVSTFTLNIFLSGELGDWDQVNTPGLITFGGFQADPYHLWELFVFAAIGVAGGSVPPPSSLVALPPSAPAPQSAALQPAWRAFQWDQPRHLEVSSCSHQHQASASTGRGRADRLALRGCCVLASERALLERPHAVALPFTAGCLQIYASECKHIPSCSPPADGSSPGLSEHLSSAPPCSSSSPDEPTEADPTFPEYRRYKCPPCMYNDMATLIFTTQEKG